jgi:hypothetical protein
MVSIAFLFSYKYVTFSSFFVCSGILGLEAGSMLRAPHAPAFRIPQPLTVETAKETKLHQGL